ncbi:MAG TPA: hypothetical protein ENI74_08035 [Gammaproteobacteria bacterium]|nr:hypothetical protein [Gammaproteobacteria bacterium]
MATGRYPYFSRIGWLPFLVCAGLAVLVAHYLGWVWSLPLWLGCIFLVYLHRDPDRDIPSSPLAVVSPADGIVTSIAEVHDPYLDREAIMLGLQMGYADVYSTRSPVEGKILEPKHTVDSDQPPHGVWLKTDEDDDLIVVMHRGPLHNSPRCYVRIGDRVGQGQRCGYIQMGGKVDVYLPAGSRVEVTSGSRVKAGSDVIATLVHK